MTTNQGSGGGAHEEVGAGEAEEDVGGPGGEEGGEGVDVAHGLKGAGDDPVGDGEADRGGDAGEAAALAHGEGEGNAEDGHDEGDEGVSELAVELDAKAHSVEAGLGEVCDVAGEFVVAHLLRGAIFFLEVGGLLVDLGEG